MKYEICIARKENIDEVFDLWRKLMDEHKKMDPVFFAEIKEELYYVDLKENVSSYGKAIFVSISEGKIMGFITASISSGNLYNSINYCTIEDLMVDSQFRKEGIGKSLIEYVVDWAKPYNAERIELHVIHKNTKGYDFFKKIGFQDSWHTLNLPIK